MASRHSVRAMREAMGLSIEDMAEKLGVHTRTVERWEAGDVSPSPMAIAHMRRVWGLHKQAQNSPSPKPSHARPDTSSPSALIASLPPGPRA